MENDVAEEGKVESYDLDEAWKEVLKAFETASRIKLHPEKLLSPQEVIDQLNAGQQRHDEAKQKHRRLRKLLNRTLETVKTFGTIAAMDQSQVLGPSNLVYAAIVILIQAGQAYAMIYERLEELFRAIVDILERFDVYQNMRDPLDLPLRKVIHGFMQSIITVCALSLKVLNGNKLTKYLKVLAFSEDSGVRKALDTLQKNVEREAMMLTTLSYRNIKEGFDRSNDGLQGVTKAIDNLVQDINRRESEKTDRRQIDTIKSKLNVRTERQDNLRAHLQSEAIEGTGSWLLEDEAYERWSDGEQEVTDIILLSGSPGHGKTFLCTRVISDLLKRKGQSAAGSSPRSAIGFYYLSTHDSTGAHDDEIFSVDKIIKTLAVHFCHDVVYRKTLSAICEDWKETFDTDELFTRLLRPCYLSRETFFVVIDGIDRANEKQLNGLVSLLSSINSQFSLAQRSRVRFLLSGHGNVMEALSSSLAAINSNHVLIEVEKRSGSDVSLFLQDQLNNLSVLAGGSLQVKQLRQEIFDTLVTTGTDFVNLTLLLQEIGKQVWPSEVRRVLMNAKDYRQRSDTIAREVTRCNTTLSVLEIRDLNVLLLWVIASRRTLRISELDAVLYLANGESPLKSLKEQLSKYSVFFHVYAASDAPQDTGRGWMVALSSDSIKQYFAEMSHNESSARLSSKVQDTEVKIVRRFLASVCDDDLYTKFGFDEFFARKLSGTTAFVHIDLETAACTLLTSCLRALTSDAEETRELQEFAANYISRFMIEIDLSLTSPVRKMEIGRHLLPLLTDPKVISRWLAPLSKEVISQLFFTDDIADLMVTYVRDSAVSKTWDDRRQWIRNLTSSNILGDIVKALSLRILGTKPWSWSLKLTFSCLYAYQTRLEQRSGLKQPQIGELKNYEATTEVVVNVFTWLADINGVDMAKDYEWNRSLARMLRLYDNLDAAIAQYQFACLLADDHWLAQYGLGSALQDRKEFGPAIAILESVEAKIQDGRAKSNDPIIYLRSIRSYIAYCYRELGKPDEAIDVYDKHLRDSPVMDYDFIWQKFVIWNRQDKHDKIIASLKELQSSIDPYFGIARSSRLLHWMSDDGDFADVYTLTRRESGQTTFCRQLLEQSINDTYKPEYLAQWPLLKAEYRAWLRLLFSEEKWRAAASEEAKSETIAYWEDLIVDTLDVGIEMIYVRVAKRLAEAYVEQLRQHQPGTPEARLLTKRITDLATRDTSQQDAWTSSLATRHDKAGHTVTAIELSVNAVNLTNTSARLAVNTTLLLARYFSTRGLSEQARHLARESVKIGIDLLSDADPENDWEAYNRLSTVLMYCGYDDDALAAWSLLLPKQVFEVQTAVDLASLGLANGTILESSEPRLDGDLFYICDGDCGIQWTYGDDIHVCKDCLDVMFCSSCIGKLRKDEIGENMCSPDHEHLHVPKIDMDEARLRVQDKTSLSARLKGEIVPVTEWLKHIRQEWQLDTVPDPVTDAATKAFRSDWEGQVRTKLLSRQTTETLSS